MFIVNNLIKDGGVMRTLLLDKYRDKTLTTAEIVDDFLRIYPQAKKATLVWNLNEMVKRGEITRIGRGKYYFSPATSREFTKPLAKDVRQIVNVISKQFKYVKIVLTDSKWFSDYLVQQPFATVVKIEVNEPAVEAVVNFLRKNGWKAFSAAEVADADKYFPKSRIFVIDKIRFYNPTNKCNNNLYVAKLEKIMVDEVCDYEAFKQYQGTELENFYANVTEKCSVNFSTVMRYASSRGQKKQVMSLLENNEKFRLFSKGIRQ